MNTQLTNRLSNRLTAVEKALEKANARLAHLESRVDNLPPSQEGPPEGQEDEAGDDYDRQQERPEAEQAGQGDDVRMRTSAEMPVGAPSSSPGRQAGRRGRADPPAVKT